MVPPPSYNDIAEAMKEVVSSRDDTKQMLHTRFNALVHFHIDQEPPLLLDCRADTTSASDKTSPDLVVTTSVAVLHDLLTQKVTPPQAFLKRQLKIKGKLALAMKLSLLLQATRQQLGLEELTSSQRSRL